MISVRVHITRADVCFLDGSVRLRRADGSIPATDHPGAEFVKADESQCHDVVAAMGNVEQHSRISFPLTAVESSMLPPTNSRWGNPDVLHKSWSFGSTNYSSFMSQVVREPGLTCLAQSLKMSIRHLEKPEKIEL